MNKVLIILLSLIPQQLKEHGVPINRFATVARHPGKEQCESILQVMTEIIFPRVLKIFYQRFFN